MRDNTLIQVKVNPFPHTCPSVERKETLKIVKSRWCADVMLDWVRDNPCIDPTALIKKIHECRFGVPGSGSVDLGWSFGVDNGVDLVSSYRPCPLRVELACGWPFSPAPTPVSSSPAEAEIRLPVRPAASETRGGREERSPERSARRSREARWRFGGRQPLHCSTDGAVEGSRAISIGIDLGEKQGSEVRTDPTCKDLGPHGRAFDGRKCRREVISEHSVEVGGEN
jgi:hypothetical protein